MNKEWEEVRQFQKYFNQPVGDYPQVLSPDRVKTRYKWIKEELDEFVESGGDIVEQADAMIDVIYFALGTLVEMGIKPDALFEIVHNANMSKIWDDGQIHYSIEGKVLKPPTWKSPNEDIMNVIKKLKRDKSE